MILKKSKIERRRELKLQNLFYKTLAWFAASLLLVPNFPIYANDMVETSVANSDQENKTQNTANDTENKDNSGNDNKDNPDKDNMEDPTTALDPVQTPTSPAITTVSAKVAGKKSVYEWKLDKEDYQERKKNALTNAEKEALQDKIDEIDEILTRYEGIPMYRLYNLNSGEHFYTGNDVERAKLVEDGWKDEGIGWYAPTYGEPVYRLYNPEGDHHYTTDLNERDTLVSYGWKDEGVGWKTLVSHDGVNAVPIYRQYNHNQKLCNHNYTVSVNEKNELIKRGWKDEEIGWYGVAPYSKVVNANGSVYFYDNKKMEPLTGDQTICGVRYYLLPKSNGEMLKGLAFLNGDFILCSEEGERLSGWQEYGGETYYFDPKTYVALTGIQKLTKEQDGQKARIVGFDQFGRLLRNETFNGHKFDANGDLIDLDEDQKAWLDSHQ